MSSKPLEFAGYVDDQGSLGRPVPLAHIVVPEEVWRDGDAIRWRRGTPRLQEVSRNMLNQFVRLRDEESVLRFATRWGVLALKTEIGPEHAGSLRILRPCGQSMDEGSDPIAAWQYYSRRARAVLNIAASLKLNKLGDLDDWSEIAVVLSAIGFTEENQQSLIGKCEYHRFGLGFFTFVPEAKLEERVEHAREIISAEIKLWLDCSKAGKTGGVSDFALRWSDAQHRWDLQIDYHGFLFAAIALQLALVVAEAESLYSCSGCGVPYIRAREKKRPKSGCANYCDRCAETGVAKRRAVESYREKKAEAIRMRARGVPVSDIAEELKTEATRILGWLKKANRK
jgi:hypothetical protein